MERIYAVEGSRVSLGRRAENMVRCVSFDITQWVELYGEGTVQLLHQRCGDAYPYPCVIAAQDGEVVWELTGADTALVGVGRAELQYFVDAQLAKSAVYATEVAQALGTTDPVASTPEAGWVAQVLAAGTRASVNAGAAEGFAASAEKSAEAAALSEQNAAESERQSYAAAVDAEESAADAERAAGTSQAQARLSAQSMQQSRRYADRAGAEARSAVQEAYESGLFKGDPFRYEDFTEEQLNALTQAVAEATLNAANICYVAVAVPASDVGKEGDICVTTE